MRNHLFTILAAAAVILCSCGTGKGHLRHLATESLRESVYYPARLKVLAVSEPDSAFGVNYFTPKEMKGMIRIMKAVTDSIMRRTSGMTRFDPDDYYVINLADRQMKATAELRELLFHSAHKGDWSGWKVKVDYEAVNHDGIPYRAERWTFIDKGGDNILRTFDIPLP